MQWIGLGNYVDILHDDLVYISLRNTAIFTIGSVTLEFLLGLLLALIVNRGVRFQRTITSILLMPMMVAGVARWSYVAIPAS